MLDSLSFPVFFATRHTSQNVLAGNTDLRGSSRGIKFFMYWYIGRTDVPVYSCFEKGCPTKPYATMPKGIMGDEGSWSLIEALGVSAT